MIKKNLKERASSRDKDDIVIDDYDIEVLLISN